LIKTVQRINYFWLTSFISRNDNNIKKSLENEYLPSSQKTWRECYTLYITRTFLKNNPKINQTHTLGSETLIEDIRRIYFIVPACFSMVSLKRKPVSSSFWCLSKLRLKQWRSKERSPLAVN